MIQLYGHLTDCGLVDLYYHTKVISLILMYGQISI